MNRTAILTIFLLSCLSCRTIKPDPPAYQPVQPAIPPAVSVISIPLEIPMQLVSEKLNKDFSGLLYNDDSYTRPTNDDLKLKVYMNKKIRVSARGNQILAAIPLSVHAMGRWSACAICPEFERQTSFEIEVFLRSGIRITADYKFQMNTIADGFEWTSPPVVAIGPLKIPVSKLLEDVLNNQLRQIAAEIDKNVNNSFDIRSQISSLWNMTAEPVLLDDSTNTWLTVKPEQISLSPIDGNDQRIRLNMGLAAVIETVTGQRPPPSKPKPLPKLMTGLPLDDRYHMQINASIGFDEITRITSAQLKGYELIQGKKKVKVEDIAVTGIGERASIKLLLSGSVKGEVYLTGIPKFDRTTEELYFEAIDFDFNTRNVLMRSASWMLGGLIQKRIQQAMRFSFHDDLESIRQSLRQYLKEYRYRNLFVLTGTLENMTLRNILIREKDFVIILDATGNAGIRFNRFDF
jgi:hypothetical protein